MSAPITYAGRTWPSAYAWCLSIMQHNAAPGPAQDGQRAALAAFRAEVLAETGHDTSGGHQPHAGEPTQPAGFFKPGHTYTEPSGITDWKFRCDSITTHPADGERTAIGWRHFCGEWEPYAYGEDDWEIHQIADAIDATQVAHLPAELTVYRSAYEHDPTPMELYTNRQAAREHCEDDALDGLTRSGRDLRWETDPDEPEVEELHIDGQGTDYTVTAVTVPSTYDPESGR